MKTHTFIILVTLVSTLGALQANVTAAPPDVVRAEIAQQSRALETALARGDAKAAAQVFAAEGSINVPNMPVITGRNAIAGYWQSGIDAGLKALELTLVELEGEGGLRVEAGTFAAFGAGRASLGLGHYLLVWKREDGTWKIHRDFVHPASVRSNEAASRAADRVGFPRGYHASMRQLGVPVADRNSQLSTAFANEMVASVADASRVQYPNGSVIAMEFANPQRDGQGEILRDAAGKPLKGEIAHIDVMRRGAGFGQEYGDSRAGEWEFASYAPDGSTLVSPENAAHCAGCHRNAGEAKDFVFRTRPWSAAE
jgi:ketosteroid isomerase-like protein